MSARAHDATYADEPWILGGSTARRPERPALAARRTLANPPDATAQLANTVAALASVVTRLEELVATMGAAAPRPHVAPDGDLPLTRRQLEILRLLADGWSTRRVAEELHLSVATVRNHTARTLRALGAHSRLQAVAVARERGLM